MNERAQNQLFPICEFMKATKCIQFTKSAKYLNEMPDI